MLKNFRVEPAAEIAFNLEKKGKKADLKGVQPDIENLTARIADVEKVLRAMIN
jgi:hypothetical protein